MKKTTRRSSMGAQIGHNSDLQVRSFSTRFSLPSFVKRVDKLSDNQRDAIRRMGFGSLLQIPSQMLCKNLLVELMERWSCEKRAFLLLPGEITITSMDVVLILGLRVIGDPIILKEDEPFSEEEREYGATLWNRKIAITSIEERLESLGGIVNEDFIRTFLLYIFGTLLFPNSNGKVDSRYLSLLKDLDKVCHFAWGTAVLEDITNWLCRRKEINVQYVGGCLIFLQIWSYEHIDIARPTLLNYSSTLSRVGRWGNIRSHQRQWFSAKFKELHKNQIVWKLQLTSEESENDMIKELLEAESDRIEVCSSSNVSTDNVDNVVRIRSQIMEQWVIDLDKEPEMDKLGETNGATEYFSEPLRTLPNVTTVPTGNIGISAAFQSASEVQKEHTEYPRASPNYPSILVISDDDEVGLRTPSRILKKKNMQLQKEVDDLRNENKLLKDQLLQSGSSTILVEQNIELKKEVENLRREIQILSLSSSGLVARLERLVEDEIVNPADEQTSHCTDNGDCLVNP